jgi:hypothetical protein
MPMIGGEMAAEAARAGRSVLAGGEAYDLGWVTDSLYGDAALPPAPLPPREPVPAHRHPAPPDAEPAFAEAPATHPSPARRRAHTGRRARQLVLL